MSSGLHRGIPRSLFLEGFTTKIQEFWYAVCDTCSAILIFPCLNQILTGQIVCIMGALKARRGNYARAHCGVIDASPVSQTFMSNFVSR
jgi:hypothetical protein